jgi:hypothetical protein
MTIRVLFYLPFSSMLLTLDTFLNFIYRAQLKAVEEGKTTKLVLNSGSEVEHVPTIGRMLARTGKNELYTNDILKQSEVDHFMRVGARFR